MILVSVLAKELNIPVTALIAAWRYGKIRGTNNHSKPQGKRLLLDANSARRWVAKRYRPSVAEIQAGSSASNGEWLMERVIWMRRKASQLNTAADALEALTRE